jgi:hypothetical protein
LDFQTLAVDHYAFNEDSQYKLAGGEIGVEQSGTETIENAFRA